MKDPNPERGQASESRAGGGDAKEALLEKFKQLKPGDVVISQSGTGRVVREVVLDENGGIRAYKFDRIVLLGAKSEDTLTLEKLNRSVGVIECVVDEAMFRDASRVLKNVVDYHVASSQTIVYDSMFIAIINSLRAGENARDVYKKFTKQEGQS